MKSFDTKNKGRQNRNKKKWLWLSGMMAVAILLVLWGTAAEQEARYLPVYDRQDISDYISKRNLTEEDYHTLFLQTGLAQPAVDSLRTTGRTAELLEAQEKFFAKVPICCKANTLVSREERIAENSVTEDSLTISARRVVSDVSESYPQIPHVEEGDILITFNSHVLGWRNGHAAIVVDAEKRLTLEARVLGSDSAVMSMEHWQRYPSFVVLRLKDSTQAQRAEIAAYAEEQLTAVPYRLTAGWGEGTHCAHLVWYAYEQFGYDLDSDGGLIVTPRDIFQSDLLEFVQVYGMPIEP